MSLLFAIVLGVVQGLTEFLPVSSSGHLVLAQTLFGGSTETDYMLFNVLLHFGTLLSVIVAFWGDIRALFSDFIGWIQDGFKINGHPYRRFVVMVLITIVPMFAVLPIKSKLEAAFSSPLLVGLLLIVTAGILLLSEKAPKKEKTAENASWLDALLVGVAQCFAVLPGLSRSGTTICAGLFRGFSRDFAVRFAFIMSLPVVLGANLLELIDAVGAPQASILPLHIYIGGILAALISGLVAIRLVKIVANRGNFRIFSVYCALIGAITIVVTLLKTV